MDDPQTRALVMKLTSSQDLPTAEKIFRKDPSPGIFSSESSGGFRSVPAAVNGTVLEHLSPKVTQHSQLNPIPESPSVAAADALLLFSAAELKQRPRLNAALFTLSEANWRSSLATCAA
jgi:hypothetical protein